MNAKDVIREYRKSKNREDYINDFCSIAITKMGDANGDIAPDEGRSKIRGMEKNAKGKYQILAMTIPQLVKLRRVA